jgi:hypothetical protein
VIIRRFIWLILFLSGTSLAYTEAQIESFRHSLQNEYQQQTESNRDNPFSLPLILNSSDNNGRLIGSIIAVVPHDFETIRGSLSMQEKWCGILILHLNVKACTYKITGARKLHLYLGRKFQQAPAQATRISMDFEQKIDNADFIRYKLFSADGPFGSSNYLIELEAMPASNPITESAEAGQTLLRFNYSYELSLFGRLAAAAYLNTLGRDKVGFTVVGENAQGPIYIQGLPGIIERNTVRFYLAIDTYFKTVDSNSDHARLFENWYDATEQFARQLHEVTKQSYLDAKANELRNQQHEQRKIEATSGQNASQ